MKRLLVALVVGVFSASSASLLDAHDNGVITPLDTRAATTVSTGLAARLGDIAPGFAAETTEGLFPIADSGVAGSTSDVLSVTLRVYQPGTYSPGLVVALQRAVTRLLEDSGFSLALVDCRRRPECRVPVRHELILRMASGRHPTNPNVCGESVPGSAGQPGVLMTAFRACVTETTKTLRTRSLLGGAASVLRFLTEADVLAPIVVHELIHLLLPGEVHGLGLWKGVLDQGDWERAAHGGLRLQSATATRLQEVLAARGGERTGGQ